MTDFVERMYKLGLQDGMSRTFKIIRNVITSLEMENFKFTTEDYELLDRVVVREELTIEEAVKEIVNRYETNRE